MCTLCMCCLPREFRVRGVRLPWASAPQVCACAPNASAARIPAMHLPVCASLCALHSSFLIQQGCSTCWSPPVDSRMVGRGTGHHTLLHASAFRCIVTDEPLQLVHAFWSTRGVCQYCIFVPDDVKVQNCQPYLQQGLFFGCSRILGKLREYVRKASVRAGDHCMCAERVTRGKHVVCVR